MIVDYMTKRSNHDKAINPNGVKYLIYQSEIIRNTIGPSYLNRLKVMIELEKLVNEKILLYFSSSTTCAYALKDVYENRSNK